MSMDIFWRSFFREQAKKAVGTGVIQLLNVSMLRYFIKLSEWEISFDKSVHHEKANKIERVLVQHFSK